VYTQTEDPHAAARRSYQFLNQLFNSANR
jgi:hypothetical protein